MAHPADWSLDPRVRRILGGLPLPIKLPTPLHRDDSDAPSLAGYRAGMTQLRDDLDLALALHLIDRGAALSAVDAQPKAEFADRLRAAGAQVTPPAGDLAATLASVAAQGDRRPLLLVHRLTVPADTDVAGLPTADLTDRLYQAGQAAALAPKLSKLVIVADVPPRPTIGQSVSLAAAAGMLRSLHKELGPTGGTCHLLRSEGAEPTAVAEAVGYLLSGGAAFLTGLDLTAAASRGPATAPTGRVALVTGAARGIGAAIAQRLAKAGCTVWINDVPQAQQAADATAAAIVAAGGQAHFVGADCSTADGAAAIARALQPGARLDVVVHNAGITRDKTLKRLALAQWRQVLAVNLSAMQRIQTAVDPLLQPGASVIMLSSVMGIAGNFGQTNYTASKAGVIALCQAWSQAWQARGIRCNAIAPGFIVTEMTAQVPLFNREMAKQLTALLQPGLPQDVAALAAFLAAPASRALSGQVVRCDGGMAFGA